MRIILYGEPRTKKNSPRLFVRGGHPCMQPSKAYCTYQKDCERQIHESQRVGIDKPVNLKAVYFMKTRRAVDLANLLEATCDILVGANVLADDNTKVVATHDGSYVDYDKDNPRVEIFISEVST